MAPSGYGVDSLVATEIRNWLSKEVSVEVGVLEIVAVSRLSIWGSGCSKLGVKMWLFYFTDIFSGDISTSL